MDPLNRRKRPLRLRVPHGQNSQNFEKFPHVWEEDAVCVFRRAVKTPRWIRNPTLPDAFSG